jgi:hypothetical protein
MALLFEDTGTFPSGPTFFREMKQVGKDSPYRLLGFAARPVCDPGCSRLLARESDLLGDDEGKWRETVSLSEELGVAPLFYRNLKAAGVKMPAPARRELQGLTVHHRYAARLRTSVMEEILNSFESAGIRPLVLKGGALGHLLYGDPGLRPSSDLDLLVPGRDTERASKILSGMGFRPTDTSRPRSPSYLRKHLPQVSLHVEGLDVKVDLHHELFRKNRPLTMRVADLDSEPLSFSTGEGGVTALTLGCEDMLGHLCLHLCDLTHEPSASGKTRLIWVADIVGFAERFADRIDWEKTARRSPWVLSSLALLHHVTPLAEDLREKAGLEITSPPKGAGESYRGWPAERFSRQRIADLPRWLKETVLPSEWWLRLYYGLGGDGSFVYHRCVRHPLHVMANVADLVSRRLEGRR